MCPPRPTPRAAAGAALVAGAACGSRLERTGSERRSVYVPLKRRAARFLEGLEATGNATLACEMAGVGRDRIYGHRRDNAEFAAAWAAAKAAFAARAEAEDGLDLAALEKDGLVVRRGRDGTVQVAAAHPKAWTAAAEEVFFAAYAGSANVSASARAAGFSGKAAWERAAKCPAFAERLAEARRAATERLHFFLVEHGTNLLAGGDGAKPDPELAMWLLKREDAARAGTLKRGAAVPQAAPISQVIKSLEQRLKAFGGRQDAERLKAGWTKSEEGHWVPPGYGRTG